MTQDQIENLARECGDAIMDARGRESYEFDYYGLARLVALVEAAERERCAELCDDSADDDSEQFAAAARYLAAAIRGNVDLTQLTTRGAVAWAGVDPQALREGN